MTPTKALDVVLAGFFRDHTIWRDPDKPTYVLSPPGEEDQYVQQGWVRLATIGDLREYFEDIHRSSTQLDPLLGLLMHDAERERKSAE